MSLDSRLADLASAVGTDVKVLTDRLDEVTPGASPTMTYNNGVLTRVDYPNGDYTVMFYVGGNLDQVDIHKGSKIIRRTFTYINGLLTQITEVIV
jgi:hypothetical protein